MVEMSGLLALRVLLAPALVALVALVAHRWGPTAGGWFVGLPLVSAPVSVLLFLEHGAGFARDAASGTLIGLVATGAFCATYVAVASRWPWWRSLGLALLAWFVTDLALAEADPRFPWRVAIALVALGIFMWKVGTPRRQVGRSEARVPDVAMRMVIAGCVVFAVTTSSAILGPSVAGMIAPLPVIAGIMASSMHRSAGHESADDLLRGMLIGTWGGAAFFVVVGALMAPDRALVTYAMATVAAVVCAAFATGVSALPAYARILGRRREICAGSGA